MTVGKYPCGFCNGTLRGEPGKCRDYLQHCPDIVHNGTEPDKNGNRDWQCPCAAAGHPGRKDDKRKEPRARTAAS